jgi:hypothetical protein
MRVTGTTRCICGIYYCGSIQWLFYDSLRVSPCCWLFTPCRHPRVPPPPCDQVIREHALAAHRVKNAMHAELVDDLFASHNRR